MNFKEYIKSFSFKKLLIGLAGVTILLLVFSAGLMLGKARSEFEKDWEENYYGNIIGPGARGMKGMMGLARPGFNPHSGLGQIIKIDGNHIIVKGPDNLEKAIAADEKTIIRKFDQILNVSDLNLDEFIVVVGRPNNFGQLEAKLIRVMPNR